MTRDTGELLLSLHTEGRPCQDTMRRWLSTRQEECGLTRSQTCWHLDLGLLGYDKIHSCFLSCVTCAILLRQTKHTNYPTLGKVTTTIKSWIPWAYFSSPHKLFHSYWLNKYFWIPTTVLDTKNTKVNRSWRSLYSWSLYPRKWKNNKKHQADEQK